MLFTFVLPWAKYKKDFFSYQRRMDYNRGCYYNLTLNKSIHKKVAISVGFWFGFWHSICNYCHLEQSEAHFVNLLNLTKVSFRIIFFFLLFQIFEFTSCIIYLRDLNKLNLIWWLLDSGQKPILCSKVSQ